MDDADGGGLEAEIAEVGRLLVQLQKYREGAGAHLALRTAAATLGDRARRLHRARVLDAEAGALAEEARALRTRAAAALDDLRAATSYRAAVDAHAHTDSAALARLLPTIFDGLDVVPSPPDLYLAVPWLRRNRPRPPADVAADVARLRRDGIEAEGDAFAPGLDTALPAVPLLDVEPEADPVVLRFRGDELPPAVFQVVDSGQYLVHVPRLATAFAVLVPLELDPEELGEIVFDHAAYRTQLLAALADLGETIAG